MKGNYDMKITIEPLPPDGEEEIVIRTNDLDERLMKLIYNIKSGRNPFTGYLDDGSIRVIDPKNVYYFESVDNRVFAYGEKEVLEIKSKLYELEEQFSGTDFLRVSKSAIVNLSKVRRLVPSISGRFEAVLKNGETVVISRQYVPLLKKHFGI